MERKREIVFFPTRYCNFKCAHCGVKKSRDRHYISIHRTKKILSKAKKQKFNRLCITGGGEPSINIKRMVQIVKLAKKYGFKTRLVTNAFFMLRKDSREILRNLKKNGLIRIGLNVDYFHLKFMSYRNTLKIIRTILDEGINIGLAARANENVFIKNLSIIKKISKDLKGTIIRPVPIKYAGGHGGISRYEIIIGKKIIPAVISDVIRTEANESFGQNNFKKMELKKLVFMRCLLRNTLIDPEGTVLPCCGFNSVNYPALYRITDVNKLGEKNEIIKRDSLWKNILFGKFGFLKLYIRAKKNKKLEKIILEKKIYSICDLCKTFLEHKKEIAAIPSPSNLEILRFVFTNFTIFIKEIVTRTYMLFFMHLREIILWVYNWEESFI